MNIITLQQQLKDILVIDNNFTKRDERKLFIWGHTITAKLNALCQPHTINCSQSNASNQMLLSTRNASVHFQPPAARRDPPTTHTCDQRNPFTSPIRLKYMNSLNGFSNQIGSLSEISTYFNQYETTKQPLCLYTKQIHQQHRNGVTNLFNTRQIFALGANV